MSRLRDRGFKNYLKSDQAEETAAALLLGMAWWYVTKGYETATDRE